jgi:Domain of unknown function (DUF4410)
MTMRSLRQVGMATVALLVVTGFVAAAASDKKPVKKIEDGVLDEIELYVATPPAPGDHTVVIQKFSADQAELGTGNKEGEPEEQAESKQMQEQAPKLLAEALVTQLKQMGGYKDVSGDASSSAAQTLIVEGQFTHLDPGSRAKRYFVGFGAGKAVVGVSGTVKDASGTVLATFKQRRIATGGWGGGDSIEKMTKDCGSIGKDLAKFLSAWAKGQKLD